MKPERWRQVDQLFQTALEHSPEERAEFISEACGDDDSLRREVEALLAADGQAGSFIEAPAYAVGAPLIVGDDMQSLLGKSIGHYRIISLLGKGGMGEVYRARDVRLGRDVAIKVLPKIFSHDAERLRRFEREAQAASALNHPNIITIHETGQFGDTHYIVTEYVEGETLRRLMAAGNMKLSEALDVATQMASALTAAHSAGIIHRDIKPENVMVRPDGLVKTLDFGMAKLAKPPAPGNPSQASTGNHSSTEAGIVMGTARYMSPEQARGLEVDARSDIFSLGVTLYEMVAGRRPFEGETSSDIIAAILQREAEPLSRYMPEVPAELEQIVNKALVKEREDRYQTIKELQNALSSLKGAASTARATAKVENLVGKIRRQRGLAFVLLALALAMTAVVYVSSLIRQKFQTGQAPLRPLNQLTYGGGLQIQPTWAPDGRFIAYSSDRSGNFDIWVQQIAGGNPIQVTKSPLPDWQPDWAPDGTKIVFRSEREGGGLFVVPALGGVERKISSFGYYPQWSPDSSRILFYPSDYYFRYRNKVYMVALDGEPPREIQPEFLNEFLPKGLGGVAWHPDSQRISVWGDHSKTGLGFWTIPLTGGAAVKSEMTAEVEKQLNVASVRLENFLWSPSGRYLYFEGWALRSINNWRNLWRVAVDPVTLRWIAGPERLTTDAGFNADIALSPDGKKLAYTSRNKNTRIWSLPFDAASGKIKGAGEPVTTAGMAAYLVDLSRDGKKLSFWVGRASKVERWEKSLEDGHEQLSGVTDDFVHNAGFWSRDGKRLVARRKRAYPDNFEGVIESSTVIYPAGGGDEMELTSPTSTSNEGSYDWSADGQWILGYANPIVSGRSLIWQLPVGAAPRAETQARVVTSSEEYELWQTRFSPDDRWVSFAAVKRADGSIHIFTVPASGGEWTRITAGKNWDDKPRWAPDGKTIYFISDRTGFLNVWGIRFDSGAGKPVGEPFRVTFLENTGQMIELDELGIAANRLVVTFKEGSGSIWTLENVDR
jgi:serine/threonine protein kinase/Tol biopolymer transport system component